MDNQLSQFLASREKTHTQHYGAHSGSHSGLSDYNDGGNLSHYGGNDDIYEAEEYIEIEVFDGKIAYGNDSETDDENDHGKYHSGL